MIPVRFETVCAADGDDSEPGLLVWVRDHLAALLVEAEGGWFLHVGLGPFEAEGLIFPSLQAVEAWVLEQSGDPVGSPA